MVDAHRIVHGKNAQQPFRRAQACRQYAALRKLAGQWTLLRMTKGKAKNNWLLKKKDDGIKAIENVVDRYPDSVLTGNPIEAYTSKSAQPVITPKLVKPAKSARKDASGGRLPPFVSPQVCKLVSKPPSGKE